MTRKLLLQLALLLVAATAGAQLLQRGNHLVGMPLVTAFPAEQLQAPSWQRPAQPKAIEVGDNQMWWGYYMGESVSFVGMGTSTAETYFGAIGITPSQTVCQGKTVKAFRFMVAGKESMKDFNVWISETLPTGASSNYTKIPVSLTDIVDNGWTEVELPTPYAVPTKTFYIGVSFDVTEVSEGSAANYPLLLAYDGTDVTNAILFRTSVSRPDWTDPASLNQGYGKLAMQVLLDGDFKHNAVSASSFLDVFSLQGGTGSARVTLTSEGLGKVSNIDYTVTDANGTSDERHLDFEPFEGMGTTRVVNIPLEADATSGRTARTIQVTKVNGVANGVSDATASGYFVTLSEMSPKRTLVEEFTGTWCGWCPRGTTGLDLINQNYPDQAVTIAIHSDDPMAISYGVSAGSYPYAMVNRTTAADPYYGLSGAPFGIGELIEQNNAIPAEASIDMNDLVLASNGRITVNTRVVFRYSSPTAPYALAYVLVADSLSGTERSWWQNNSYSRQGDAYGDDPNLKVWTERDSYVNLAYNHVAIDAKDVASGISGSIKAPLVDGATQTHTTIFSLSGNQLTQHIDKLSVVAMLINTNTGTVVNATVKPVAVADNFPVNSARVSNFDTYGVVLGQVAQVPVTVTNLGGAGVKSIDYTIRAGRIESDTMHIELDTPITGYGLSRTVNFAVPSDTITGSVTRYITLRGINGQPNESTSSCSGRLITMLKPSKRKTVFEEFTGTWCGWCPRGTVSMNHVADRLAGEAIAMAIHGGNGDPMQVAAYATQLNGMSMPSVWVNRYIKPNDQNRPDAYYGYQDSSWGLPAIVAEENAKLVEAGIELSTPVLDEETGIITFSTDVTFQLNRRSAPYLLAYTLLADGLTGTSSVWAQTNYYPFLYSPASFPDDEEMASWTEKGLTVTDIAYNHVVVAGTGVTAGITGSLSNKVEEGQVQTHSAQFNISSNALAKQAEKLTVVALLYDKERGGFINADSKVVVSATGIATAPEAADGTATEVARYTVDGKRIAQPQRGINIIRLSNGEVRKVVVK